MTAQRTHDGRPLSHWSVVGHDENGDLDGEICRCEISDNHFTDGRPWPDDARFAMGGLVGAGAMPEIEHPAPYVIRPRKVIVLHMVYPDGTHTGDCAGCLWSQEQPA